MEILKGFSSFDRSDNQYPCEMVTFTGHLKPKPDWIRSTLYGVSLGNGRYFCGGHQFDLFKGAFFSFPISKDNLSGIEFVADEKIFLVLRHGYQGQSLYLGEVERKGRLSYVDGCSDSLLVYPARLGDPSLNFLFIPPGTRQTSHSHPTLRLGLVLDGQGTAETLNQEFALERGMAFLIEEHEIHRFKTAEQSLSVIAFHPDGDFGPSDRNHTMINRSYFNIDAIR
jgi:hypothetical protein